MCPCQEGRAGAFMLAVSLYWAFQVGGIGEMLHLLSAENGMAIWWAVWTGLGAVTLVQGVIEARSHDDNFNGGSVAVSVGLIGLALWALAHRWFWVGPEWTTHISRVVWPGLIASETFNLWLNLRGRRHAVAPVAPVIRDAPRPQQGFRLRRRRRIEVLDEIDADSIEAALEAVRNAPPHASPDAIEGGRRSPPQIVYVPDEDGQLIPVALPPSRERVRR